MRGRRVRGRRVRGRERRRTQPCLVALQPAARRVRRHARPRAASRLRASRLRLLRAVRLRGWREQQRAQCEHRRHGRHRRPAQPALERVARRPRARAAGGVAVARGTLARPLVAGAAWAAQRPQAVRAVRAGVRAAQHRHEGFLAEQQRAGRAASAHVQPAPRVRSSAQLDRLVHLVGRVGVPELGLRGLRGARACARSVPEPRADPFGERAPPRVRGSEPASLCRGRLELMQRPKRRRAQRQGLRREHVLVEAPERAALPSLACRQQQPRVVPTQHVALAEAAMRQQDHGGVLLGRRAVRRTAGRHEIGVLPRLARAPCWLFGCDGKDVYRLCCNTCVNN